MEGTLYTGIIPSAKLVVSSAAILEEAKKINILLTSNPGNLEPYIKKIEAYLEIIDSKKTIKAVPFPESPPRDLNESSKRTRISKRLSALLHLHENSSNQLLIVSTPEALFGDFPQSDAFIKNSCFLKVGAKYDYNTLIKTLTEQLNYDAESSCENIGEIAVRGGLIDIYPINQSVPFRIDFFGDEIESIRIYDPASQRSIKSVQELSIPPSFIDQQGDDTLGAFLPKDSITWILDDPNALEREHPYRINATEISEAKKKPKIPKTLQDIVNNRKQSKDSSIGLCEFDLEPILFTDAKRVPLISQAKDDPNPPSTLSLKNLNDPESAIDRASNFFQNIEKKFTQGKLPTVHCLYKNKMNRELISETLDAVKTKRTLELSLHESEISGSFFIQPKAALKYLKRGFIQVNENDIIDTHAPAKNPESRRLKSQVLQLLDFSELIDGDILVHLQHGLCRYRGITYLEISGTQSEVITVEFDQAMQLHVPMREAHLLTRYLGFAKKDPKLAKIGSAQWIKTRTNAEHATLDYASKLLKLHAERAQVDGYAFPEDHPWQKVFEDGFPHTETRDQLIAIKETKDDMEQTKPMDRLICGDVGYGKTEIAIRACFKAIMAGKQVAFLVPTTVLCQQHFNSFKERVVDFPIEMATVSGFHSAQENKKILASLAEGKIDLVIGTHRLLSKDVHFPKLGLLVIDEEQRFGVKQKEKIKEIAQNVDILTLTATPIPRTLHLALSGARSMSVIESPPVDRKPIETIVKSYDIDLICEAIIRETSRGGQVFYLHNRVESIDAVAGKLRELLPDLKIAVGHGQMDEGLLEKTMVRFINGEFNVLVCTTIIESGIDIPNCNTLIIEGADRFGLAQLYQIRGRVGRFNRQAYAYLFLHRHIALVESAHKRLSTLKQYNQLGSGFKIAMRDLELRGAGNLLGAEQSGHIMGIGFELYCQLLKESIARLRNEPGSDTIWTDVNLDFILYGEKKDADTKQSKTPRPLISGDTEKPKNKLFGYATIPKDYISEASFRIYFHRALSMAKHISAINDLQKELADRFGEFPEPVQILLKIHKIRILGAQAGFSSIRSEASQLKCTYAHTKNEFYKIGARFPRLTQATTKLRLNEIQNFLKKLKKK